jgi:hypothetical protein
MEDQRRKQCELQWQQDMNRAMLEAQDCLHMGLYMGNEPYRRYTINEGDVFLGWGMLGV